jgi:hypothetical protein
MHKTPRIHAANNGENIDEIISSIDKEINVLRLNKNNNANTNNNINKNQSQNGGEDTSSSSSASYPRAGRAASPVRGQTVSKNYSDAPTEGDDDVDDEDATLLSAEAAGVSAMERKRIVDNIESANKTYAEEKLKTQEEEKKIAEELKKSFGSLKKQLEQYKARYEEAKDKLWDEEDKQVELQEKIEQLQDEILTLQENLKQTSEQVTKSGGVGDHRPVRAVSEPVRVTDDGMKNNQIRRALLFEDYEQDSGDLSYYDKVQHAGFVVANINALMSFLTPFRKDITKIRSHMGSSVASYFVVRLATVIITITLPQSLPLPLPLPLPAPCSPVCSTRGTPHHPAHPVLIRPSTYLS